MKAITLDHTGGAENLKMDDIGIPAIQPNEVLVKLKATSINPVEAKARESDEKLDFFFKGQRPAVLGWDISGVVEEVGHEVSAFREGDEVFGMINFPGMGKTYAEYVAAPAAQIAGKPPNITHQEAASASLAALTAWQVLTSVAKIQPSDRVLIHAAAGGVGHFMVQLAKHLGAYVIGTSSAKHKSFVMQLGADEHIDYKAQKFEEVANDMDFVIDVAGGNAQRSVAVTRQGGTIICVPDKLSDDEVKKIEQQGVHVKQFMVTSNGGDMKKLADLLEKGIVKAYVSKSFTLAQISDAHRQIEHGGTVGKIGVII